MTADSPAQLWERLLQVKSLAFVARSASSAGWNGAGGGKVVVEPAGPGTITFTESGTWRPEGGDELHWRNVFRWSLTDGRAAVRLEHLRFGPQHPVYLFDLAPAEDGEWQSVSPHQCGEDCYAAHLTVRDDHIALCWTVTGPKKHEAIEYTYS